MCVGGAGAGVRGGMRDHRAQKRKPVPLTHPRRCHTQPSDHPALDFLKGKSIHGKFRAWKTGAVSYVVKELSHWAKNTKENSSVVSSTITLETSNTSHPPSLLSKMNEMLKDNTK